MLNELLNILPNEIDNDSHIKLLYDREILLCVSKHSAGKAKNSCNGV